MNAGLLALGLAYVLSQFFRAFLAVLSPLLQRDLGASPDDLAIASGYWFLAFAAMQIPVGWALDTIGPRRTAGWLLLVGGGGGSALFALATQPLHIALAMALIGVGCAPVLMASYYIFARDHPPARFAVLASLMVGLGSMGNLVASWPMALAADWMGWRASLWGLAAISAAVALATLALVRDPKAVEGEAKGSLAELFRLRVLWLIYPMIFVSYAVSAAIRGLWIGPYLAETFAQGDRYIATATLLMGIAMIAGSLTYGPADRVAGSRKWLIVAGSCVTLAATLALALLPRTDLWLSVALMCAAGFFGATYPVLIAHGRSFLPPHLIGRGVTMLNLFSLAGVGILQFVSGRVYAAAEGTVGTQAYVRVFALLAVCLAAGLVPYLLSRDSPRD